MHSSVEAHKALVANWLDAVIVTGNELAASNLVAADCVDHMPTEQQSPGRDGHLKKMAYIRSVFSNRHLTLKLLLTEADFVVDHWQFEGDHTGAPFLGVPASGRHISLAGIDIVKIRDGQIAEIWHVEDFLQALRHMRGDTV